MTVPLNKSITIINRSHFQLSSPVSVVQGEIKMMVEYLEKYYQKKASEINFCLMNKKEIQSLNHTYLNKNAYTDTLSFIDTPSPVSGDIALCPEVIFEDALKDKKDFSHYFTETILHSLLHLFGMTHNYTKESLKSIDQLHKKLLIKIQPNWSLFNVKFST